ncbi:MAG: hypothetical protein MUF15_16345 [Acidobacteria bacterium]|nr:hypothetical protein [Acidobacteriota bacterium]
MRRLKTKMFFWAVLLIFTIASNFGLAYTIIGHCQSSTGSVPYGAVVKVYEVDPIPGGSFKIDEIALTNNSVVDQYGNFIITTTNPYGSGGFEAGGPDLIFTLLQNINNAVETIYQETSGEAHWNIIDNSSLSFQITSDLGVFCPPGSPAIPGNKYFLFTRVGSHETADIDCKGSDPASQGYYKARRAPYSRTGIDSDMPYGSILELFGWFGQQCNIDYYKVKYLPPNLPDVEANWVDVNTNLPNKWYDMTPPSNPLEWKWVSESMGPFTVGGVANLYKIPHKVRPNIPWSYIDRVACFDSRLVADGLCRIKVTGYKLDGSNVVPAKSPNIIIESKSPHLIESKFPHIIYDIIYEPNYGTIKLQIDNTPPTVGIIALKLNGTSYGPCAILQFGNSDTISLDFKAFDQRGHLRNYSLIAMYGHNQSVSPTPTSPNKALDNYASQPGTPVWQGNMNYITAYPGNIYTPGMMPTCAYQFRLSASKRTTNGYGLIYDGIGDTWHVTIQR